jgi:hypothetical protein
MVPRRVCSRMEPAEATEDIKAADDGGGTGSARSTRHRGKSLTRPAFGMKRAVGTATSLVTEAEDRGGRDGCGGRVFPNRLATSQIENGAVKGTMTRTTSQEAKSLGSIVEMSCLHL